ncbi:ABC transporter permease [Halocynthiibacter namhaensis]|uniref:ABC transporter permease n=1 Tax=Halocynthiibacter namhaensis TaxID=1290553 RepID=UPI0005795943|nr:ABC transporter permease [Halocynthiibacter namhaensis]
MRNILPILAVVFAMIIAWYAGAFMMNKKWTYDQANRAGVELTLSEVFADTMAQPRPVLPAPHQVAVNFWETTVEKKITSRRSLVFHGWITLKATLTGFILGTIIGTLLAVGIVYSRVMDMSILPWAIISQTVPIVAIAPMIVVLSNSVGIEGHLVPKTIISAYLSFFPVLVSMIKGLRSPDRMQLDLLRTWGAGKSQTFWKLRLPGSMPFFFAAVKIAIAASLVGAIVGELPMSGSGGLGARMLVGSQYGEPLLIWSALAAAALLAAVLIFIVGTIQTITLKRMGMAQ